MESQEDFANAASQIGWSSVSTPTVTNRGGPGGTDRRPGHTSRRAEVVAGEVQGDQPAGRGAQHPGEGAGAVRPEVVAGHVE